MCGIFAVVGASIDQQKVDAALATLRRRGPDDQGTLAFPKCTLAQTRLSIVDLSDRGHQPMRDNERPHSVTFNGEIYGYKDLRKQLEDKGHRFVSNSDTETILKSYTEYGTQCIRMLDGMFALALWDETQQLLLLARDRFGKKPLYYAYDHTGALVVASEIKALVAYGITPKISKAGIDAFLALMYVPPSMTFFENVFTLPPGHLATYANGSLKTERYWHLPEATETLSISYEEAKEETRRLLHEAVQKRMVADVEVGAFLSGGVDSSLITAYAAREMDRPIKTFSLGYGEYINELPFAAEAAEKIGSEHRTLQAGTDLIPELEALMAYFDEPHADSADLAQSVLSEFTARHVKVALAGDGGDELFMGYGWYWAYHNRPKLITLKNALFSDQFTEHIKSVTVFPPHLRRRLMRARSDQALFVPQDVYALPNDARRINAYDLASYLPGQLLTKVDRTSMMHGLEVRCPLLDYRLAEFAYRLPLEYKIDRATGKFILKDLLAEIMPRSFVDRKKQGFGAPVRKWLREDGMRKYVLGKFGDDARIYEMLDNRESSTFIRQTLKGNDQKAYYQVWVLLCLELWLRAH